MSHPDDQKKYLNLDGVRVSYKAKDDTIHITSTDPDVQTGGFHLSLTKGTQTEETLRDLLIQHGVIRSFVSTDLNSRAKPISFKQPTDASTGHSGQVITVTSARGGAGKTTLALLIAATLSHGMSKDGKTLKVCVVDMDTRDGQVGFLLGQSKPTALNVFLDLEKDIDSLTESLVYDKELNIHALLAPKRARNADYLTQDFYRTTLTKLRDEFDVVIVDTSTNYLDFLKEAAYEESEAVLFVTQLSRGSLSGAAQWEKEITLSNEDILKKTAVVINQAFDNSGVDIDSLQKVFEEVPIIGSVPSATQLIVPAANNNELETVILQSNEVSRAVFSLTKNLFPDLDLISSVQTK